MFEQPEGADEPPVENVGENIGPSVDNISEKWEATYANKGQSVKGKQKVVEGEQAGKKETN